MSVMTGATCLGAAGPQPSKVELVTSSVEASRGVDWRTEGDDPCRPFHDEE
jgi:hypothetical protein